MIFTVRKYLIFGLQAEIDQFFKSSQKSGIVEFINPHGKYLREISPDIKEIVSAIKVLKREPKDRLSEEEISLPPDVVAQKIVSLEEQKRKYQEEREILRKEIARISPFGNFSHEDILYIAKETHRFLQFFCIKTVKKKRVKIPEELIYVGTEYDLDYYIAVVKEKIYVPKMLEIIIEKPLGELKERFYFVDFEIKKIEEEIRKYAGYISLLRRELVSQFNHHNLQDAKKRVEFPLEEHLFSVEAWIPENHISHFQKMIEPMAIDYVEIAIEKRDRIPTYMENKGIAHMGEDLVKIYDIPSIVDKDPSHWVLAAFAVFFAMITSDAGYGLLYFLLAFLLRWKIPSPKAAMKRFINLIFLLAISSLIWGGLSGSFFGIGTAPNSLMGKTTFLNYLAKKKATYHLLEKDDVYRYWTSTFAGIETAQSGSDFLEIAAREKEKVMEYVALDTFKRNIMMELSLLAGVLHIGISLLRGFRKNWANLGWVIFMIGGYLYFPSIVGGTSLIFFLGWISKPMAFAIGLPIIYAGISLSMIGALVQNKLSGLKEAMNVVQVFADVLSYLRLYALGLAGMIMASTFNDLGASFGFFIGPFIILVGHGINIALAIMGGIIHGLRLNFLEWYHYSFEGNGKLFNPLKNFKS